VKKMFHCFESDPTKNESEISIYKVEFVPHSKIITHFKTEKAPTHSTILDC